MKKLSKLIGIIALTAVIGFSIMGCEEESSPDSRTLPFNYSEGAANIGRKGPGGE